MGTEGICVLRVEEGRSWSELRAATREVSTRPQRP